MGRSKPELGRLPDRAQTSYLTSTFEAVVRSPDLLMATFSARRHVIGTDIEPAEFNLQLHAVKIRFNIIFISSHLYPVWPPSALQTVIRYEVLKMHAGVPNISPC